MDEYGPFWFLAFIGLIFFVRFVVFEWRNASWNKPFRLLAEYYGGTHQKGIGWKSKPTVVRFEFLGANVAVKSKCWLRPQSRKNYVQFQIDWIDPSLRCEIRPKPLVRRIGEFFTMRSRDMQELEKLYLIDADQDTDWLITPGLRWAFAQLDSMIYTSDVRVTWQQGKMTIKAPLLVHDFEHLLRFTHLCLEFYEEACTAAGADITFLQESEMEIRDVICNVCGEPIEDDIVWCRSCRTPHHQECWQYAGACSIFACGQKRYIAAGHVVARHSDQVVNLERS